MKTSKSTWSCGTADAVLMVESEAKMLSEEIMLGAVVYGHEQMQSRSGDQGTRGRGRQAGVDWTPPRRTRRSSQRWRRSGGDLARPTASSRSRLDIRAWRDQEGCRGALASGDTRSSMRAR